MNKHTTHTRFLPVLAFLMVGSFLMWLIFRQRSLKEECTHFEYDFRFWRNLIVGAVVTILVINYAVEYYYDWADAQYWERIRNKTEAND